ncbi:myb domain-containing protein [Heterostelium album PN500]|uniref:Myb domain-containing protein n=1 Tax=Heterostelium pallidum (strain ATCC 26659 / Pp 5 / PN500) TaxID=670386 RepID=D3AW15_HETP5|nr:myb domain-containing protein [Heterostelium album PN500]EFA86488.1 myb domain-containing protein [Heterostelium album PN500]|eukprot:XP_020438593.1 myb domain-containing protein [Heterostelium album PN500]
MNPHIKGYPDPYEYCGSSPSPPNIYSPIFRPMYPFHYSSNRYMDQPADEEQLESKMMPYYEQTQRFLGRIQFLEDEINRKKDTIDGLQHQLSKYEQERQAEKKKQSRYWTPDEHHRFLEALSKIDRERQRKLESKESSDKDDRNNDEWLKEDYGEDVDSPTLYANCSPGVLTPNNPFSGQNSPNIKRKRETVLITASQAKNAQMYKDAVLSAMPSGWTAMDYEYFSRGLISFIDQDDVKQFLVHHSIETIELAYKAFHKAVNQKPKEANPNSPGGNNSITPNNSNSNIPNSPQSSLSPNLSTPNLQLVLPNNNGNNNSNNSNNNMNGNNNSNSTNNSTNNTPEPTSPTHFSRSPSLGKRRVPPPVNVSRPEYPIGQMPPGPAPSPSSMYGGGMTYLGGPNGSPPMGMIHPLSHLHPSSPSTPSLWPRPYDMRRLEPPPPSALMTPPGAPGYFMGPHPMMMEHHVPGDDNPNGANSNGHGSWQSPYHLEAPNGANWSMNHTISALSNTNLNNSSSSSLGVSTD